MGNFFRKLFLNPELFLLNGFVESLHIPFEPVHFVVACKSKSGRHVILIIQAEFRYAPGLFHELLIGFGHLVLKLGSHDNAVGPFHLALQFLLNFPNVQFDLSLVCPKCGKLFRKNIVDIESVDPLFPRI